MMRRSTVSIVLVVVGAILLIGGGLAVFVRDTLVDSEEFVWKADASLRSRFTGNVALFDREARSLGRTPSPG